MAGEYATLAHVLPPSPATDNRQPFSASSVDFSCDVSPQHYLFYPIMSLARPNLYAHAFLRLVRCLAGLLADLGLCGGLRRRIAHILGDPASSDKPFALRDVDGRLRTRGGLRVTAAADDDGRGLPRVARLVPRRVAISGRPSPVPASPTPQPPTRAGVRAPLLRGERPRIPPALICQRQPRRPLVHARGRAARRLYYFHGLAPIPESGVNDASRLTPTGNARAGRGGFIAPTGFI
ncbi:MAG: hypothetical protein BJ554DRAFT_1591 [Olpidium bornovanus]|uniref:Uncharacterized protein n=1 Tax=Olpidium bornovanus TaxID=278681 RepID=A0A8H8DHB5_9FUNG|nr:MAG: hypothetical protein BJ554DRAFT_1591 [Olpidium bornovanus]